MGGVNIMRQTRHKSLDTLRKYIRDRSLFPRQSGGYTYHKNFTLNGHDYLVQFIWENSGAGFCAPH